MSDRVIARIVQDLRPTRELTRMRRRRRNRRVSIGPNIGLTHTLMRQKARELAQSRSVSAHLAAQAPKPGIIGRAASAVRSFFARKAG